MEAAVARCEALARELELTVQIVRKTVSSPAFHAHLQEGIVEGSVRNASPWVDRALAEYHWPVHASGIDKAVQMGILTKQFIASTPVFEKAEGDLAIREGRWLPFDAKRAKELKQAA